MFWNLKVKVNYFAVKWNYSTVVFKCGATNYMMEPRVCLSCFNSRRCGNHERGGRKLWPLHLQSGFPLNLTVTEEEHATTAALCFLCGQPAATGTSCHAGASAFVYIYTGNNSSPPLPRDGRGGGNKTRSVIHRKRSQESEWAEAKRLLKHSREGVCWMEHEGCWAVG